MERLDKDSYYLGIAVAVSKRSTCLKRHYGCVIVKDDIIIATGYNGSPRDEENCCDRKCDDNKRTEKQRNRFLRFCHRKRCDNSNNCGNDREDNKVVMSFVPSKLVNWKEVLHIIAPLSKYCLRQIATLNRRQNFIPIN